MAQDAIDLADRRLVDRALLGRRVPQLTEGSPGASDPGKQRRGVGHEGRVQAGPLMQPIDRLAGCTEVVELAPMGQPERIDEVEACPDIGLGRAR